MRSVSKAAENGVLIIGICNGFQILTEAGLLPGVLMKNKDLRFHCHDVYLRVDNNKTPFTLAYSEGEVIKMNIAHGEGNYYFDHCKEIEDKIVLRYCDRNGNIT
ncbi:phosphoribosylformylglycinamidine synthase subunit PurQ, partial [Pseudothermotoga sp.]